MIKTYYVDHSIAGACAYKIIDKETNQTILYSGDIRIHGRNKEKMEKLVKENKNIDYLIVEGTNLSRKNNILETEQDIEKILYNEFSKHKFNIIACSPINTDRIISVYNATVKANKILVIDPYTAYILETLKENKYIPQFNSKNILVYFTPNLQTKKLKQDKTIYKYKSSKITFKEIMQEPNKYIIKNNAKLFNAIIKKVNIKKLNLIHSYWQGYLENENYSWHKYKNHLKIIHTSGHIDEKNLIEFVQEINPKQIIPIHTLNTKKFAEEFKEKVFATY